MSGADIASIVLNGLGAIAPLAARLIGAGKAESIEILRQMRDEVDKAVDILRDNGVMDEAFAASDAKLDKAIADAEANQP